MPIVTTAILHLVVILLIGIVVGLVLDRLGRSWLGRQAVAVNGSSGVTSALVGIAGSFIGFHLAVIIGLLPTPLMLYVSAVIGAAVTIWLWRGSSRI